MDIRDKNVESRKLDIEKLWDLYQSLKSVRVTKSRRLKWASNIARMDDNSNALKILIAELMGKRQLGRP